jgi:TonB family protein
MRLTLSFLSFFFLASTTGLSQAPDTPQELARSLEKQAFVLRHFYIDPKLKFDSRGQTGADAKEGFGPSDGTAYVLQTQLLPDKLVLSGRRPVYLYVPKTQKWQMTNLGKPVSIEIQLPANEPASSAIPHLIGDVFLKTSELANFECSIEERQQLVEFVATDRKAKQPELPPVRNLTELRPYCLPGGDRAYKVGRGIKAPHVKHAPDPEYSEDAKQARIEGTSNLIAVVNPSGSTSAISIVKPLGENLPQNLALLAFQLDQRAVEAVSRWKFDPAAFGATPVPVVIKVEVNFRLRH